MCFFVLFLFIPLSSLFSWALLPIHLFILNFMLSRIFHFYACVKKLGENQEKEREEDENNSSHNKQCLQRTRNLIAIKKHHTLLFNNDSNNSFTDEYHQMHKSYNNYFVSKQLNTTPHEAKRSKLVCEIYLINRSVSFWAESGLFYS